MDMQKLAATTLMVGLIALTIGIVAPQAEARTTSGKFVKVVDGDTIHVKIGGKRRVVNLLGLKTPGRNSCSGRRSRAFTATFLRNQKAIRIRTQGSRKIGAASIFRAEIYRRQGRKIVSLNLALIRSGHARIRTSRGRKTSVAFRKAERFAKARRLATWGKGCAKSRAPRIPPGVPAGAPTPAPRAPRGPSSIRNITALLVDRHFSQSVTREEGDSTVNDDTDLSLCPDFSFELNEFLVTDDALTNFENTTGAWSLNVAPDLSRAEITLTDHIDGEIIPIDLSFLTDTGGNTLVLFDREVFTSQPATDC